MRILAGNENPEKALYSKTHLDMKDENTSIAQHLAQLKQALPASCRLVAVSKTHPAELIQEAYDAGQREFGENKVQELVPKYEALPKDIVWHMIGHLQSNKVKYIAPFVSLIHSIDSFKLLEEVNRQGSKAGRVISCLLQVHVATEETKFGFSREEVLDVITSGKVQALSSVHIQGLMGMATFTDDVARVRKEFGTLRALFEELKQLSLPANVEMKDLSMGMSGDYPLAIEEGSTVVRVGSAIFGHRDYSK
jgi:pyridoxal phosphate enzyme (YggS family)